MIGGQDQLWSVGQRGACAVRLSDEHVEGVHMVVRDGRTTDAGLRGSRVAELIMTVAASNQVSDEVRHLMPLGGLLG
jgi:hypothetical protein